LAIVWNISPTAPTGVQFGHPDAPAGLGHPQQLRRGFRLIGGEHRAEDRHRHIELAVVEGQVLGVGLDELDPEPLRRGAFPAPLQQRRHVVGADDAAPTAPRRRDRTVAAAAGDVEHPLVGDDVEPVREALGDRVDERRDHREVAFGPDPLLDLGNCLEVRRVVHLAHPLT